MIAGGLAPVAGERTLKLTRYPGKFNTEGTPLELSFAALVDLFKNARARPSKDKLPLIQGITRPGNSRAEGTPIDEVFVVVVEHDFETISIDEAQRRLQDAGIESVLYTTASHRPEAPRWRAFLPLSAPVAPCEYQDLASAANAALGGVLSRESWEVSRCYYYQRVEGVEYQVRTTAGIRLDVWALLGERLTADAAQAAATGVANAAQATNSTTRPTPQDRVLERAVALGSVMAKTVHDLRFAVKVIPADERGDWVRIGHALKSLDDTEFAADAQDIWVDWTMTSDMYKVGDEDLWDTFKPSNITYLSVFAEADKIDAGWRARAAEAWASRTSGLGDEDVPTAQYLCTDTANANRILKNFGGDLLVVEGTWYTYDGARWRPDESRVYRMAGRLGAMINAEAALLATKVCTTDKEKDDRDAMVMALRRWAQKSEQKNAVDSAVGLIRKWLRVEADQLDADKWALNCLNGTLDLKTGTLRPHDPKDLITKICPVNYKPDARSDLWLETVEKACLEYGKPSKPLTRFLQKWYGYCATGITREQKFAILFGAGSNAKSTINDAVSTTLGDYASTAPPELIVSARGGRHPTEIADLLGRRMVTANESGQNGELREDFVKQATGGDRLKGRLMRKDFFEFVPTHKLQLITNYRPTIKGTDHAIWRRVMLIPFRAKFVTAKEFEAGVGDYIKDTDCSVKDVLGPDGPIEHREAVLAWVVAGTKAWNIEGLDPPDIVLVASKEYQSDQDRVAQFVDDYCEVGLEHTVPLGGEWGGLYFEYREWCKANGHMPVASGKLVTELERVVPGFRKGDTTRVGKREEKRRKTPLLHGLRLLPKDE